MASFSVETLVPTFNTLGEGPYWSETEACLYYVDILGKRVCRYDPATKENVFVEVRKTKEREWSLFCWPEAWNTVLV